MQNRNVLVVVERAHLLYPNSVVNWPGTIYKPYTHTQNTCNMCVLSRALYFGLQSTCNFQSITPIEFS